MPITNRFYQPYMEWHWHRKGNKLNRQKQTCPSKKKKKKKTGVSLKGKLTCWQFIPMNNSAKYSQMKYWKQKYRKGCPGVHISCIKPPISYPCISVSVCSKWTPLSEQHHRILPYLWQDWIHFMAVLYTGCPLKEKSKCCLMDLVPVLWLQPITHSGE